MQAHEMTWEEQLSIGQGLIEKGWRGSHISVADDFLQDMLTAAGEGNARYLACRPTQRSCSGAGGFLFISPICEKNIRLNLGARWIRYAAGAPSMQ